jgi:hypothetical protein
MRKKTLDYVEAEPKIIFERITFGDKISRNIGVIIQFYLQNCINFCNVCKTCVFLNKQTQKI